MIETGEILNKYGMIHNYLWYLMSSVPFHCNLFIAYTDAIVYDVLIFDVIKSKAPEFVGHLKTDCQFQCLKKFLTYFYVIFFITPCELK